MGSAPQATIGEPGATLLPPQPQHPLHTRTPPHSGLISFPPCTPQQGPATEREATGPPLRWCPLHPALMQPLSRPATST